MGQRPLTLPQVAAAAGVEYATLHSWLRRGLLSPSLQVSTGTGSPNLFSSHDAITAKVLVELRSAGVDFDSLQKAARELQTKGETLSGDEVLVINGSVELLDGAQTLRDALQHRQPAVVYEIAWASEAVAARLSG